MATYTETKLYQGQPATGGSTLYTVPGATTTIVKQITIANTTGTPATVSIRVVPSGGTAGIANSIGEAVSIAANATVDRALSIVMATGDFIQALQGTASAITLTISGVQKV